MGCFNSVNKQSSLLFTGMCLAAVSQLCFQPAESIETTAIQPVVSTPADLTSVFNAINALAAEGWNAEATNDTVVPPYNASAPEDPLQASSMLSEFHCTNIVGKALQRGQRRVLVQAYRFDSPLGAYGAYSTMREGASTVVTRGDASSEDDQSISFWQDNYFIRLSTTSQDDEESKDLLRVLADKISASIANHAQLPQLISRLPNLDRIDGTEKLVMGPIAARKATPLPLIGLLSLEKSQGAASADYHFTDPNPERMKLLLVNYGDGPLAASVYRNYTQSLSENHKGEILATSSMFKVSNYYLFCQLRGERMCIISGARKRVSPYMLMRQLSF